MRKSLLDIKHMVREIPYPGIMPDELLPYHYYILDGGHCIMCVLECHLKEVENDMDMDMDEVPVPVKYVLEKGYRKLRSYIIIDAKYDPVLGLVVDDKYSEY